MNTATSGDSVLRVDRNKNYKTISLLAVHDPTLSWKAKGVHTYLVSRPDGWKFRRADLEKRATDGRRSLDTALKQLKARGYLTIEPTKMADGQLSGWTWTVSESPKARNV